MPFLTVDNLIRPLSPIVEGSNNFLANEVATMKQHEKASREEEKRAREARQCVGACDNREDPRVAALSQTVSRHEEGLEKVGRHLREVDSKLARRERAARATAAATPVASSATAPVDLQQQIESAVDRIVEQRMQGVRVEMQLMLQKKDEEVETVRHEFNEYRVLAVAEMQAQSAALREVQAAHGQIWTGCERLLGMHDDLRSRYAKVKDEQAELKEGYGKLESAYVSIREAYVRLEDEHDKIKADNARIKGEQAQLIEKLARLESKHEQVQCEHGQLVEKFDQLSEKLMLSGEEHKQTVAALEDKFRSEVDAKIEAALSKVVAQPLPSQPIMAPV